MKWIIYLLLIVNIGFAAWHFRGAAPVDDTALVELDNDTRLILLSEYRQQRQDAPVSEAKLCYSLGPFIYKPVAEKAQALLKKENVSTRRIHMRDTGKNGFWVILPAAKSRKTALDNIKKLKKHNIRDYFLVATGPFQNAVSLGVFSQKTLARRRVDDMIRLGFIPSMLNVPLPRKVYWLNWHQDAKQQPANQTIIRLKKQSPQISKSERSCK